MANFMIAGGFAAWAVIGLALACAVRLVQSARKRNRLGTVRWKLGGITLSAGLVISMLSAAMGIVELSLKTHPDPVISASFLFVTFVGVLDWTRPRIIWDGGISDLSGYWVWADFDLCYWNGPDKEWLICEVSKESRFGRRLRRRTVRWRIREADRDIVDALLRQRLPLDVGQYCDPLDD